MAAGIFGQDFDLRNANPGRISSFVRHQGEHSTCVAMSAIELIQSAQSKSQNKPAGILSVQQLISGALYNPPPSMPTILDFFKYAKKHPIIPEEAFPYQGEKYDNEKRRRYQFNEEKFAKITGYCINGYEHVDDNPIAVAQYIFEHRLPVSIALLVREDFFKQWDGVWNIYEVDPNEYTPDLHGHRVTVVGYGTDQNVPFYVIKNSSGEQWGIGGYGRIIAAATYGGESGAAFSAN